MARCRVFFGTARLVYIDIVKQFQQQICFSRKWHGTAILRYKVFSDSIWRLLGPDFNKSLWLFFQQIKGKRQANTHGSIIRKSNTNFFDILFRKLAKKRRVKYISTLLAYQYRERGIWMRPRTDAWLLLQKSYI